jgi:hypothetical protein
MALRFPRHELHNRLQNRSSAQEAHDKTRLFKLNDGHNADLLPFLLPMAAERRRIAVDPQTRFSAERARRKK